MFTDAPASNNTVTISMLFSAAIWRGVCPNLSVASRGMSINTRVLSISIQAKWFSKCHSFKFYFKYLVHFGNGIKLKFQSSTQSLLNCLLTYCTIPLLHPILTTICNRVSPVSVLKLGLSPRLTMDLNFSTFFALTDSSIWYCEVEILHLRLNSRSLWTSCNNHKTLSIFKSKCLRLITKYKGSLICDNRLQYFVLIFYCKEINFLGINIQKREFRL